VAPECARGTESASQYGDYLLITVCLCLLSLLIYARGCVCLVLLQCYFTSNFRTSSQYEAGQTSHLPCVPCSLRVQGILCSLLCAESSGFCSLGPMMPHRCVVCLQLSIQQSPDSPISFFLQCVGGCYAYLPVRPNTDAVLAVAVCI
jgi:hypothetical protein